MDPIYAGDRVNLYITLDHADADKFNAAQMSIAIGPGAPFQPVDDYVLTVPATTEGGPQGVARVLVGPLPPGLLPTAMRFGAPPEDFIRPGPPIIVQPDTNPREPT